MRQLIIIAPKKVDDKFTSVNLKKSVVKAMA